MKFAERLEEARIPEYAAHYIDYRGLKRILSKIKVRVAASSGQLACRMAA